jgi:hypothetical protein
MVPFICPERGQVANNRPIRINRCRLGPVGPLGTRQLVKKRWECSIRKVRTLDPFLQPPRAGRDGRRGHRRTWYTLAPPPYTSYTPPPPPPPTRPQEEGCRRHLPRGLPTRSRRRRRPKQVIFLQALVFIFLFSLPSSRMWEDHKTDVIFDRPISSLSEPNSRSVS